MKTVEKNEVGRIRRNQATCDLDVVGTGFTVLDRLYADSISIVVEELGGSCGNVLICLAMLRRRVAPVLSLGKDEIGARLTDAFRHAGAETRYIRRRINVRSPILAQHLDPRSGAHSFAFHCPHTQVNYPRYRSIDGEDLRRALPVIRSCSVFYTDRLSPTIVKAMEAAAEAGSTVYFEPSRIEDEELFGRATKATNVLKFSDERLGNEVGRVRLPDHVILIVTYGEVGLEIRRGSERLWCPSQHAPIVRDTCGAGDMVSVGVIDRLLSRGRPASDLSAAEFAEGVRAGQRLAADNCSYLGARGLFRERGPDYARFVLGG